MRKLAKFATNWFVFPVLFFSLFFFCHKDLDHFVKEFIDITEIGLLLLHTYSVYIIGFFSCFFFHIFVQFPVYMIFFYLLVFRRLVKRSVVLTYRVFRINLASLIPVTGQLMRLACIMVSILEKSKGLRTEICYFQNFIISQTCC